MQIDPSERKALLAAIDKELSRRRLDSYAPYKKQRDFHDAGDTHRERLFMAGNQLGKTVAGAAEMAIHLTGKYPDDWKGRRFSKPIAAWASGVTGESVRDTTQASCWPSWRIRNGDDPGGLHRRRAKARNGRC